jgi:hypothetical protein
MIVVLALLLAATSLVGGAAGAGPLLPAKALWKAVKDFRGYPRFVEGLKKVKVRKQGTTYRVSLVGSLLSDYRIRVRASATPSRAGGVVRWTVEGEPSSGEMRVDEDHEGAVFSLASKAKKTVDLPDLLVVFGLKTAILAVGESVRKALESAR